jgi:hypothetical protein
LTPEIAKSASASHETSGATNEKRSGKKDFGRALTGPENVATSLIFFTRLMGATRMPCLVAAVLRQESHVSFITVGCQVTVMQPLASRRPGIFC